jgi:CHRD domain
MNRRIVLATLSAAVAIGAGTAVAAGGMEWKAKPMIGANEVPANSSTAEARASFEMEDGVIHYKLRMRRPIDNAFMAHIHLGAAGANGPIVVWLYGTPPPSNPANVPTDFDKGDVVARGTIDAGDLVGLLAGKPLSDLITALNSGNAYVNLHTTAYPGGEVRAQVTVDD